MEYDEIPTIPTNEKSYNDQLYTDNTQHQLQPPPPPPTRIESLRLPPVPPIRSTVSLGFIPNNDDQTITTAGSGSITAEQYKNEKNSSNLTATQQHQHPSDRNSINGRPLPPLPPRPICLKESKESDEDSPLYGDDSDTEENSDYDDKYDTDNDIDQSNRNDASKLIENSGNIEKIHDKSNATKMDDKNVTDNNDIINNKIISNGVDRNQNRG